jgi:WD40 repeat protein
MNTCLAKRCQKHKNLKRNRLGLAITVYSPIAMSDQSTKPMPFSREKYFEALAVIRELIAALANIREDVLCISPDDMTNEQINLVLGIIDTHTPNVSAHSATLDQSGSLHGHIASGFSDGTIRLWDPATGSCSAVFEGHQDWVYALAVLPDGRLASGSGDRTIRLWDPATGSCSAVLEGHQDSVRALAVLPDGRLASGSGDSTVRLWDPATGSCSAVFEGHQDWVYALAVLP